MEKFLKLPTAVLDSAEWAKLGSEKGLLLSPFEITQLIIGARAERLFTHVEIKVHLAFSATGNMLCAQAELISTILQWCFHSQRLHRNEFTLHAVEQLPECTAVCTCKILSAALFSQRLKITLRAVRKVIAKCNDVNP